MAHDPSSKFRLMAPQWLGTKERKQGAPKDKRSQFKTNDEESVLLFCKRTRKVTIRHDQKILALVLTVNPGIKSQKYFSTAF